MEYRQTSTVGNPVLYTLICIASWIIEE